MQMYGHGLQRTSSPSVELVRFLGTAINNTGKGLNSFSETALRQRQSCIEYAYSPHVIGQYPSSLLAGLTVTHPVTSNDLMR